MSVKPSTHTDVRRPQLRRDVVDSALLLTHVTAPATDIARTVLRRERLRCGDGRLGLWLVGEPLVSKLQEKERGEDHKDCSWPPPVQLLVD